MTRNQERIFTVLFIALVVLIAVFIGNLNW